MTNIAFIPARSGSQRVKNKNIRLLGGRPLLSYSVEIALKSNVFDGVYLVTDSVDYQRLADELGCDAFPIRPLDSATSDAPDILWVTWAHEILQKQGVFAAKYCILRPTSPFRTVDMIQSAFDCFGRHESADTLRAVQKVKEHPGKMWIDKAGEIVPLLPFKTEYDFWHNSQTNTLPEIFIQNASLEIFLPSNISLYQSITGRHIIPFETKGFEGFDINTEADFSEAQILIDKGILRA